MEQDWKCLAWGERILRALEIERWRIEYTPSPFSEGAALFVVQVIHVHWPEGRPDYALLLSMIALVVRGEPGAVKSAYDEQYADAYTELVRQYMHPQDVGAVPRGQSGWLIESAHCGPPHWLARLMGEKRWTKDAEKAIRFSRRCDAERLIDGMVVQGLAGLAFAKATEHQWGCGDD